MPQFFDEVKLEAREQCTTKNMKRRRRFQKSIALLVFFAVVVAILKIQNLQIQTLLLTKELSKKNDEEHDNAVNSMNLRAATTDSNYNNDNNSNNDDANDTRNTVRIAYAITITECSTGIPFVDAAAVLKHSIHRASIHGTQGGAYDYAMYAFYHPDAEACALPLQSLGYHVLKRSPMVQVEDIQGRFLRSIIRKSGCCGEKELIKFEAYTLVEHPIVVHLDLDSLVLKPIDKLFDMMLLEHDGDTTAEPEDGEAVGVMWPQKPLPKRINAFYTYDYNTVTPGRRYNPVQGGFLVTRPSLDVYEEYKDIVRVGNFTDEGAWGGVLGRCWGDTTFQGLVPYYYDILHPGESVELNRCIYNQMNDYPTKRVNVNGKFIEKCNTGEEECENCRIRPVEDVYSVHYAFCPKAWRCTQNNAPRASMCRKLTHQWYKARSEVAQTLGFPGMGDSTWERDQFFGFCRHNNFTGYQQMTMPIPALASE